jgi:hypothetical protein
MVRTRRLPLGILVASYLASACYPWPHTYVSAPEVSGVLLEGTHPVVGAKVLVAHTRGDDGQYCRDARVVTTTWEGGKFQFDAVVSLHPFTSVLNPPETVRQMSSICFEVNGQQTLGAVVTARTDRSSAFTLSCDLSGQPRDAGRGVAGPYGVCRIEEN